MNGLTKELTTIQVYEETQGLKIGDKVVIVPGELIPIDGKIIEGEGLIDTSSLTGEYIPVQGEKDVEVFSGCLLKSGTLTIIASKEYKDSAVSKIVELISNSGEKKSKADKFITKFARWYTPTVFILSILFAVFSIFYLGEQIKWNHIAGFILLVLSSCLIYKK